MIDVRDAALAHIMALYDSPFLKRRNLLTTTGGPYLDQVYLQYYISTIYIYIEYYLHYWEVYFPLNLDC